MKIVPIRNMLVLEKHESETKTAAGLVLVENNKNSNVSKFKVVAIGENVYEQIKIGMVVFVPKYTFIGDKAVPTTHEVLENAQTYHIVDQSDIIGYLA